MKVEIKISAKEVADILLNVISERINTPVDNLDLKFFVQKTKDGDDGNGDNWDLTGATFTSRGGGVWSWKGKNL